MQQAAVARCIGQVVPVETAEKGEGRIGGHGSAHNVSANQCSIVLKVALRCQTPRNA